MKLASTSQMPSSATSRVAFVESLRGRLLRPGRHWVFVSVAMYALACVLPAMPPIFSDDPIPGWVCLTSMMYGYPPWWANPTYFVAVIASLMNRSRIAVIFAVAAALLAMSLELIGFYDHGMLNTMKDLLPGCLMWIASLQLLACFELWRQWLDWQQRQECLERQSDESVEISPVQSSARQ
ncbi:MAG: hypothetical protein H7062_19840 [Candidatus Saccharimonas sp.]|nr:hypothetical protein [Planctomycetaceae bacterium]